MSHAPLQKILDELSGASTTPLSEMRPLFGSECYELIGHIRRLELGITSPGLHRNLLDRLCIENAELRAMKAGIEKNAQEVLQLVAEAVAFGDSMANTLRSTSESLALCQRAYQEERERLDYLDQLNNALNAQHETVYGWRLDWNHNRTSLALRDCYLPALKAREAIDAARIAARKEGA